MIVSTETGAPFDSATTPRTFCGMVFTPALSAVALAGSLPWDHAVGRRG
jgi:hypothetical protein